MDRLKEIIIGTKERSKEIGKPEGQGIDVFVRKEYMKMVAGSWKFCREKQHYL